MPRDLGIERLSSGSNENEKPQGSPQQASGKSAMDIDDFETVEHDEAQEAGVSSKEQEQSHDDLALQRFAGNLEDAGEHDEDDDSDDDEHSAASHPLLGMLAGRLGQRRRGSTHKYDHLHPENQVLTINNVDDCCEVEQAFPEHERCTREKVSLHQH